MNKLLSGRWILTVMSGVAFLYMVWSGKMSAEAAASIISMVFVSYFNRKMVENGTSVSDNDSK